jgi:hypothetical protein
VTIVVLIAASIGWQVRFLGSSRVLPSTWRDVRVDHAIGEVIKSSDLMRGVVRCSVMCRRADYRSLSLSLSLSLLRS